MQIFTRQVNESIVIGGSLHVTVLEIHEDHVRLAFSCEDGTPQYWEEIVYVESTPDVSELEYAEELLLQ